MLDQPKKENPNARGGTVDEEIGEIKNGAGDENLVDLIGKRIKLTSCPRA